MANGQGDWAATPEDIAALQMLTSAPEEMERLKRQMEYAALLRDSQAGEMRGNGRVMVAQNPMEHIGRILRMYHGHKKMAGLEGQETSLIERLKKARDQAMLMRARQPSPATPPLSPVNSGGYRRQPTGVV